jgi:SRSO17 transposase
LPEAVVIIDETSFPKKGTHSVGVARQYCRALGKTANCQVAVSVHLGTETTSLALTCRLYLPQEWIDAPVRRAQAKVPEAVTYATKNTRALDALDAVLAWSVGARVVLADAGHGTSHDFSTALAARGVPYCVQTAPSVKGWITAPPAALPYRGGGPRARCARALPARPSGLPTV